MLRNAGMHLGGRAVACSQISRGFVGSSSDTDVKVGSKVKRTDGRYQRSTENNVSLLGVLLRASTEAPG